MGSHDYADPAFDTDPAARWGMALAFPDWPTTELVSTYEPDVVVVLLGLNDVTWLQGGPADVDGRPRSPMAWRSSASVSLAWFGPGDRYLHRRLRPDELAHLRLPAAAGWAEVPGLAPDHRTATSAASARAAAPIW